MKQDAVDHTDNEAATEPSALETTSVSFSAPTGVTGNKSEASPCWAVAPPTLSKDQLVDAQWLGLSGVPVSPAATALVTDLVARVANYEIASGDRKTKRGQAGEAKLRHAVGALVAALLRRWGRPEPQAVFRSRKLADFTGGPVAAAQYLAACDGLAAMGLIRQSHSIRYVTGIVWDAGGSDVFKGKASRIWPAQALLDVAAAHGVTPATVATDFVDAYPTTPPKVPRPVEMTTLKTPRGSEKTLVRISDNDAEAAKLATVVKGFNEWVAQHDIRGCQPPRFKRVFTASWLLHGRWYAVGNEGNYQRLSPPRRLGVTINGERVAEVDVRASALSIMHGLIGLPLPQGDPYEIDGLPRSVAKAWITATLGKGSPVRTWAIRSIKALPELAQHDAKQVGRLVVARYPFLSEPAKAVAKAAGLDKLVSIGTPAQLLTLRLMAIEAQAVTGAMLHLRDEGVLALPIHDSLLVPISGLRHVPAYLTASYSWAANRVRVAGKITKAGESLGAEPTTGTWP